MTDRELLEHAAKAAGIVIKEWDYGEPVVDSTDGNYDFNWNPLTDDGDALRLAVKLRLHAKHFSPYEDDFDIKPPGMVEVWQEDGEDPLHIEYFKPGDDTYAATRRAIVRAAAEIGRK